MPREKQCWQSVLIPPRWSTGRLLSRDPNLRVLQPRRYSRVVTERGSEDGAKGLHLRGRPEIVLAVVSPIGTGTGEVCRLLGDVLDQVTGYDAKIVRISELIETAFPGESPIDGRSRYRRLMDMGDALREGTNEGAICAMLAVQAIREVRESSTGDVAAPRYDGATILRSLKHPDEVTLLRQVYGQRALIVGVSEEQALREGRLRKELAEGRKTAEAQAAAAGEATELVLRDEKDELRSLGQRVRDAYEMCDVYLPASGDRLEASVRRLVGLMFGQPFITPSRDEMGAWHAYAAQFRSSAAGRQVGAAIVDADGEILATGCNDVPTPGGGQSWEGGADDHRDFAEMHKDANDSKKFELVSELLSELRDAGWFSEELASLDGDALANRALAAGTPAPLQKTRVADLLEFGRIMHAEMAALMTAARRGTPVRGATLYTTTYPCHECMRLIIGAGITRVVYIDPYPKSLVPELLGGHLHVSGTGGSAVHLDRFVGVAPRMVPRMFSQLRSRKRDLHGTYETWSGKSADYIGTEDRYADTTVLQEHQVGEVLGDDLTAFSDAG